MPITDTQKELRKTHLGSSDMAALFGLDPYKNAYDVWLEKTGQLEDLKESEVMYAGTMFEDGVLKFAEKSLGKLKRNQYRVAQGFPIGSNIDAIAIELNDEPVEAKTGGLFGPLQEVWGEANTDEVPDRVIIQDHVHMLCTDRDVCHTPVFLGGRGFLMYKVNRDKVIMNQIMDESTRFWDEYVIPKIAPPNVMPSMAILKRIVRVPSKIVEIEPALIQHWQNAISSRKTAEEIEESAKAELLAALGDAEAGNYKGEDGLSYMLTYFMQQTRRIDEKKLKEEKPDIAKQYEKILEFRVPRIKKPKIEKF
jgi:putative phage-type endonuclease